MNSIFWDNDGETVADQRNNGAGELDIENAIIEGGFPDGEAVLADDPRFVRAPDDGPDDEWGTDDDDDGDLHLLARSPAADFGDTGDVPQDVFDLDGDGVTGEVLPFDLDGEDRVQDGRVDLGAYEGVETPVSSEGDLEAATLALSPAAPTPTRRRAAVGLVVEAAGPVEVAVFDLLGRAVAWVHSGPLAAGRHVLEVDASALPAGVYVVRAASASGVAARPVTVVR